MSGRRVFGVGPVTELVQRRPREIAVVFVNPARKARQKAGDPVARLAADARGRGIAVEERSRAELDELAGPGARHQGVVAIAGELDYADPDDMVRAAAERGQAPLIVALDGVQDPRNLGAIIRSAHLLGAHGVIVPEHRATAVTATVTKAAAGATEHLPIARVTNLVRTLEELKAAGLWLAAVAAGPDAQPLWQMDGATPLVLVLGAEGTGVRPLVARTCDFFVEIPMAGAGVGSLNVSVAAAIALYEIARQRAAAS